MDLLFMFLCLLTLLLNKQFDDIVIIDCCSLTGRYSRNMTGQKM